MFLFQCRMLGSFHEETEPTIGAQFKSYSLQADGHTIELQIWDAAGQGRFKSVAKAYFQNAVGGILVFDLTSRQSFDELNIWINDLNTLCAANAHVVFVGNKTNLTESREINASEAEVFGERYSLVYLEASAKNGSNVADAFVRLETEVLRKVIDGQIKLGKPLVTEEELKPAPAKSCC